MIDMLIKDEVIGGQRETRVGDDVIGAQKETRVLG